MLSRELAFLSPLSPLLPFVFFLACFSPSSCCSRHQPLTSVSVPSSHSIRAFSQFPTGNLSSCQSPCLANLLDPFIQKQQPKTLPHALSRAAASSSMDLRNGPAGAAGSDAQTEERLGKALGSYSLAMGKVRPSEPSPLTIRSISLPLPPRPLTPLVMHAFPPFHSPLKLLRFPSTPPFFHLPLLPSN
jgi:hypothetical protein